MCRKLFVSVFCVLCFVIPGRTYGQESYKTYLAVHIDHIEEFIERFNFYPDSRFYRYVETYYPDEKITRNTVLSSIFNKTQEIPDSLLKSFIESVNNPYRSTFLDIYDALWYAQVPVRVTLGTGETLNMQVTLEIQLNSDYSIEWVIAGMRGDFLDRKRRSDEFFISSSSHATFFPELYRGLREVNVFQDVVSDNIRDDFVVRYSEMINEKGVKEVEVLSQVKYHFLQIPGWIMTVSYKPLDRSYNTGWLIDELIQVKSFREKRIYQLDELNVKNGL